MYANEQVDMIFFRNFTPQQQLQYFKEKVNQCKEIMSDKQQEILESEQQLDSIIQSHQIKVKQLTERLQCEEERLTQEHQMQMSLVDRQFIESMQQITSENNEPDTEMTVL